MSSTLIINALKEIFGKFHLVHFMNLRSEMVTNQTVGISSCILKLLSRPSAN